MGFIKVRYIIIGIIIVLFIVAIPITLFLAQKSQVNRSKASAATVLSLEPATISATQNTEFSVDVFIDPGSNIPSILDAYIPIDAQKIEFVRIDPVNGGGGLSVQPAVTDGVLHYVIGFPIGQTTAITKRTKSHTIVFKSLIPGSLTLSFDNVKTRVLSLGINDGPGENVLSTTIPTQVTVAASTLIPSISPGLFGDSAQIFVQLDQPGIGSSSSVLRNKRQANLFIIDKNNTQVAKIPFDAIFKDGSYGGIALWGQAPATPDVYTLKVQIDNSLVKGLPGIYTIQQKQVVQSPKVMMVTGDIDSNNQLDALDYKFYTDCIGGFASCTDDKKIKADLNDDGKVDELDLNIFQRNYTVRLGD